MPLKPYNFDNQIERTTIQFIKIFSGFQVKDAVDSAGNFSTERIPVYHSTMDRISASIMSKREHFTAQKKIPLMVVSSRDINMNKEDVRNRHNVEQISDGNGGFKKRIAGIPLRLSFTVHILADSLNQLYEIVEQVLLAFHQKMNIDINDTLTSGNHSADVMLDSISSQISYPLGVNDTIRSLDLNFSVDMQLSYPSENADNIIEEIHYALKDPNNNILIDGVVDEND